MPRNVGQNQISKPKTDEVPLTQSYFSALKNEKVAINHLKQMNKSHSGKLGAVKRNIWSSVPGNRSSRVQPSKPQHSQRMSMGSHQNHGSQRASTAASKAAYAPGRPELFYTQGDSNAQIVNFMPDRNRPIPPMLSAKQRVKSAAVCPATCKSDKEDLRVRMLNQVQKVNSAFYGTLRANTMHKHNYDDIISSEVASNTPGYAILQQQSGKEMTSARQYGTQRQDPL
jgi:hypothetical protein